MAAPAFQLLPDQWDMDSVVGQLYIIITSSLALANIKHGPHGIIGPILHIMTPVSMIFTCRAHNRALPVHLRDVPPPRVLPLRHLVLHEEQDRLRHEQCSNQTQGESPWHTKTGELVQHFFK